ncbi:DoxX family protein [Corynebacterium uterequi]|uniref:DoxX protein n=1 Tax=Corynebacterium uterequi TaxID=1072256 RepID=A0A0G3HHA5_9CORY|nr:membrane protein [Corynebacterium uterequi]AKK10562.1 hypothetical protein CUTER_02740 [Corynebacterium uterequi]
MSTAPSQHRRLATVFAIAGTLHFVKPEIFDQIVPPQLPGKQRDYTLASGAAELAVAGMLAAPKTRRAGGLASVALLLAVWPANFYMAYLWRDRKWPWQVVSIGRLPYQIPLIKRAWSVWKAPTK